MPLTLRSAGVQIESQAQWWVLASQGVITQSAVAPEAEAAEDAVTKSSAVGTLWTDYEDDESEAHYEAKVTRFIKQEDQITFEFAGHDPDEGAYTGWCKLARTGEKWAGEGEFIFPPNDRVPARVVANLTSDKTYY